MFSSKLKQLQTDWLVHCVPQAVKRSGGKDIYVHKRTLEPVYSDQCIR